MSVKIKTFTYYSFKAIKIDGNILKSDEFSKIKKELAIWEL